MVSDVVYESYILMPWHIRFLNIIPTETRGHQAPGGIRWVTPITVTLIPPLDFAQYLVIAPYFSHSHGKNHGPLIDD